MTPMSLQLSLPAWLGTVDLEPIPAAHDRMLFVLALARRNVQEATGGPFAAAVLERDTGAVVSLGVNCVLSTGSSVAHAEIMALGLAEQVRGTYDLGAPGQPALELVSSSQMCAMCLGAVVWSGVREVAWATPARDVLALGFDEGPTPPDYVEQLQRRGIGVAWGVARREGLAVLREYARAGGPLYNPTRGGKEAGTSTP